MFESAATTGEAEDTIFDEYRQRTINTENYAADIYWYEVTLKYLFKRREYFLDIQVFKRIYFESTLMSNEYFSISTSEMILLCYRFDA